MVTKHMYCEAALEKRHFHKVTTQENESPQTKKAISFWQGAAFKVDGS